jgi:3-hydroxyisobutyrate dehydrogenase-like beta-hydroxyacid dehydrogenase
MTNPSKKTISLGFIGLGNMGLPIAANLLKAGYQLRVYNRTAQKADPLIASGAKLVSSPNDVIEPGGIVFSMLADDAALESIAGHSSDFVDRFAGGGIHVSMSTIAPRTARDLAEHHAKGGIAYLAAPVIGRPDRAAAGLVCRGLGRFGRRRTDSLARKNHALLMRHHPCLCSRLLAEPD